METRELTSIVFPTEPNVEYVVKDKNGLKQEDVRKASSAMSHEYRFNQLFSTDNSTLPSANGLTITDIYGGHHVAGTTDGQYYHKMYIIDTIRGHWYYFAPNFSNIADVFIGAHIDGTYFSTNHGKVFEGGDKFDIAIQIAKGKTLDFDVQPILVDLTEMFGAGNEPKTDKEVYPYIASGVYYPTMLLGGGGSDIYFIDIGSTATVTDADVAAIRKDFIHTVVRMPDGGDTLDNNDYGVCLPSLIDLNASSNYAKYVFFALVASSPGVHDKIAMLELDINLETKAVTMNFSA